MAQLITTKELQEKADQHDMEERLRSGETVKGWTNASKEAKSR